MTLYILNYNNYYNRIMKSESSVQDYLQYEHYTLTGTNFNPSDCVNTTHVFGTNANMYDGAGDYLLVVNEDNTINSRWFIIETKRERNGQWTLQLRRDLFADYWENIINADCFIEKATLSLDDPLIFNNEQMTVNQIKTNETSIKDKTECPWIVGYYAKNTNLSGTVPINVSNDTPHIALDGSLSQWKFYDYCSENEGAVNFKGPAKTATYNFVTLTQGLFGDSQNIYYVNAMTGTAGLLSGSSTLTAIGYGQILPANITTAFVNYGMDNLNYPAYSYNKTQEEFEEINSYNGKIIKDTTTGKFYNCTINTYNTTTTHKISSGALFDAFKTILSPFFAIYNATENSYQVVTSQIEVFIDLEEIATLSQSYEITSGKLITENAPYDIFAIPYGEIKVINGDINDTNYNTTLVTTNAQNGLTTAAAIQVNAGTDVIYDVQLLPYCPIQELITDNGEITVTSSKQYSLVKNNDDQSVITGIIFNVSKDNFEFNITDFTIPQGQSPIQIKLNNECDKWRLCSPNYSNYFDFSAEKNNGVSFFNIDCNYKPYTPYIHISPDFDGLYGDDYNDPRGLVLGGDFSLSQVSDAWVQYQLQNKNYQNIFDRQIQNMEVQNIAGRTHDIVGGITGTASGAASGALAGSLIPGVGTVAGAVVGGVFSAAAGIGDYAVNEMLRNEAIDYRKDLFKFNLGNIQALPETISKVSAFNLNNKIFPVLEYYTCTDREKEAFINKIAWNGMTVGVIGKISEYILNSWNYTINNTTITSKNYIKAQLIRLTGVEEDYHIINSIAGELNKGVYIK